VAACGGARAMPPAARPGSASSGGERPSGGAADEASDRVFVAVRARPLVPTERAARAKEAVFVAADARSILVGKERSFTFDAAFGAHATQESIYTDVVAPLVEGCFAGACRLSHGGSAERGAAVRACVREPALRWSDAHVKPIVGANDVSHARVRAPRAATPRPLPRCRSPRRRCVALHAAPR
jgi:hypothetical protein